MQTTSQPGVPATYFPGLLLVVAVTVIATLLARLPPLQPLGALGLALILGLAWRARFGLPDQAKSGVAFAAKHLLRLGIVLLGVRLNFNLLLTAGPLVLGLSALMVVAGIITIERLGRALNIPRPLRLSIALGSGVCGASAIAAGAGVVRADDEDVCVSVALISLLGTVGVLLFVFIAPLLGLTGERYGLLAGATLHEVGQVFAAAAAGNAAALQFATITKLTRVALLAPALLVVGAILRKRDGAGNQVRVQAPLLPGFLLGFLLVGAVGSLGFLPAPLVDAASALSSLLLAAGMAGIGLGVDLHVVRRLGLRPLLVGIVGFLVLLALAGLFVSLVERGGGASAR